MSELADIGTFINKIEHQFQEPPAEALQPETRFRIVPKWDSLQSLIVIASFQNDYGVTITDEEFVATQTLRDLYELVMRKKDHA
jgi:acyl carrier protein